MKNKTILVTGGAGFIGSHTAEMLINNDFNVVVVDNFNDYYNPGFKKENIKIFKDNDLVEIIEGDISNFNKLKNVFEKYSIDKIIHLAARAGVRSSIENPHTYYESNIKGTLNLLELSKEKSIDQFIFASSSSVYGNREFGPFKELDRTDKPTSPYAATKQACERLLYSYHNLYDIKTTIFRFFTVYGERGRPDMAPYIFTRLILNGESIKKFGDGTSKRDYTYVKDIVRGIKKSLEKDFEYEIINLGSSNPIELNQFIHTIEKISNKKAKIKQLPEQPGDVQITHADNTKAKDLLDWKPELTLEEGLTRFINWFNKNRL